jgi:hypothetical protein
VDRSPYPGGTEEAVVVPVPPYAYATDVHIDDNPLKAWNEEWIKRRHGMKNGSRESME